MPVIPKDREKPGPYGTPAKLAAEGYLGVMHDFVPSDAVKLLSRITPARSVVAIAVEYGSVALAAVLSELLWHPLLYLAALVFIGSRQHALLNLLHDAAHYRLFMSKRLNDRVARYLLGWPCFYPLHSYRATHFAHHRHFLTEHDPTLVKTPAQPVSAARLAARFLFNLTGIEAARYLIVFFLSRSTPAKLALSAMAIFVGVAASFGFYPAQLWILYWLLPLMTWLVFASDIRFLAEHWLAPGASLSRRDSVFYGSRIIEPTLIERIFIARKNVHLHLDHHLYPSVPSHRLPRLHRLLISNPEYRKRVHVTRGYLAGVLKEMIGRRGPVSAEQRELAAAHPLPLYSLTHSSSFLPARVPCRHSIDSDQPQPTGSGLR